MNIENPFAWQPPTPEEVDALFPELQVDSQIGRGGMGAVYLAGQPKLKRDVAIKLLPKELGEDPEFSARFEREAQLMAGLVHPNILPIFDFGSTADGHRFYITEFVSGGNLAEKLRREQEDFPAVLDVFSQICNAVEYAHSQGIVHRDLKPSNVLCGLNFVKVADFGLAKIVFPDPAQVAEDVLLTGSQVAMGTLHYAAPEQLEGRPIDQRADIYSLGVILYQMLTGTIPQGFFPPVSSFNLPRSLDSVVERAMASSPEKRYQSVARFRDRLREADAIQHQIKPIVSTLEEPATLPLLSPPDFPPSAPTVLCRIAVVPTSDDLPPPPFQWLEEVTQSNFSDIVQLARPSTNSHRHLVALRSCGTVVAFNSQNCSRPSNTVYVTASPILRLTIEGELLGLDSGTVKNIVQLRCADQSAISLNKFGQVVGHGKVQSQLNVSPVPEQLNNAVQIESSLRGHAAVLHKDGRVSEITASGRGCSVSLLEGKYFKRLINDEFGIASDGETVPISTENEAIAELSKWIGDRGSGDEIESIDHRPGWALIRGKSNSWRVFTRSRVGTRRRTSESDLSEALKGATAAYGQSSHMVGRLGHIIALFPSDQLPYSGFWTMADLLKLKND